MVATESQYELTDIRHIPDTGDGYFEYNQLICVFEIFQYINVWISDGEFMHEHCIQSMDNISP